MTGAPSSSVCPFRILERPFGFAAYDLASKFGKLVWRRATVGFPVLEAPLRRGGRVAALTVHLENATICYTEDHVLHERLLVWPARQDPDPFLLRHPVYPHP